MNIRMDSSVDALLPSTERARADGVTIKVDRGWLHRERSLLESTPVEEQRLLAVAVRGRFVHRTTWSNVEELGSARLAALPTVRPPLADGFASQRFTVAAEIRTGSHPCPHCSLTPGRATCARCSGQGYLGTDDSGRPAGPCDRCETSGTIACSSCDATARSQTVLVEYGEDQISSVARTFVPPLPADLGDPLGAHIDAWADLPEALAYQLDSHAAAGAPYRSAVHEGLRRWGFVLDDARDARTLVARLRDGTEKHAVRAYTIPVLVLYYDDDAAAVLAPGPGGGVVGFGGFVGRAE